VKTSPTQRTLKLLRDDGWLCYIVEKWNMHAKIRQDAYGFGDILAMCPGKGIMLVQACAGASHAARRQKILDEPRARMWLQSGGGIHIVSWSKKGAAGKRKLWEPRLEEVKLVDFEPEPEPIF
jgi:hypothetical protein